MKLDVAKDIAPKFEITVRIVGVRKWKIRLWLAGSLLRLGAWVANMPIKFEDKPWHSADI